MPTPTIGDVLAELERFSAPPRTFTVDFLNDPTRREWLGHVANHYSATLDQAFQHCSVLEQYTSVCYLVDFDVLRTYLETRTADHRDTYAVDCLFSRSPQQYALPLGAFLELLDWLTRTNLISPSLTDLDRHADRRWVLRNIAQHLQIQDARIASEDELLPQVLHQLDDKTIVVSRLLSILNDQRFVGVVGDYDERDADEVRRLLETIDRPTLRFRYAPRSKIDTRDAINIAIAIKSARLLRLSRRRKTTGPDQGYILVSQTSAVLRLLEFVDVTARQGRIVLKSFAAMLGLEGLPLSGRYPVLHPTQALVAESLGVFTNPSGALLTAKRLRDNFRVIASHLELENHLFASSSIPETFEERFGAALGEGRQQVSLILSKLATEMFSGVSPLYDIEQFRSNAIAIEGSKHNVHDFALPANYQQVIQRKTANFTLLLKRLASTLDVIPGFDYKCNIRRAKWIDHFEICQEPADILRRPVIEGEIHKQKSDNATPEFFVARWPVLCSERTFIRVMKQVLRPFVGSSKEKAQWRLLPLTDNTIHWTEGLIIFTSKGAFSSSLAPFLNHKGAQRLRVAEVQQSIYNLAQSRQMPTFPNREDTPEIQQYRVNTRLGDFIFDLVPSERERARFLTVMAHSQMGEILSILYEVTGTLPTVQTKLARSLTQVLSAF